MKRIVIIYPILTSYNLPILKGMAESGRVQMDVLYGPPPAGLGFRENLPFEHPKVVWKEVDEIHPFGDRFGMSQKGIFGYLKKVKPDAILIWANPRYLSFWGVLLLGRIFGIPVYARGQGLFKKNRVSIFYKLMYKSLLALSHKYICYTDLVKSSLLSLTKLPEKLVVDFNTIYNEFPVLPHEKNGQEKGIFYIGRVRDDCGVEPLIESIKQLRLQDHHEYELHIIGDGPMSVFLEEKAALLPWLHYYGGVFDQKVISGISRKCRFGCVPGFMGLNVVHMMSLSLPVITHSQLDKHMGPEPEYIQHKINGWLIENPNDVTGLKVAIRELWQMPAGKFKIMQVNASKTYEKLSDPPLHERILQILDS